MFIIEKINIYKSKHENTDKAEAYIYLAMGIEKLIELMVIKMS